MSVGVCSLPIMPARNSRTWNCREFLRFHAPVADVACNSWTSLEVKRSKVNVKQITCHTFRTSEASGISWVLVLDQYVKQKVNVALMHKKLSYRRRTGRRALSVENEILSTAAQAFVRKIPFEKPCCEHRDNSKIYKKTRMKRTLRQIVAILCLR